jgi:hypothetical protein
MERRRFDTMSMPPIGHRVPTCRRCSIGSNRPPHFQSLDHHHVSHPMPCRGIAYQPRVQTLGTHPDKETRVLKERRMVSVSRTSAPAYPMRCSFRTHLFSGMRFPGRCPGLVCVAPLGQLAKLQRPASCGAGCWRAVMLARGGVGARGLFMSAAEFSECILLAVVGRVTATGSSRRSFSF